MSMVFFILFTYKYTLNQKKKLELKPNAYQLLPLSSFVITIHLTFFFLFKQNYYQWQI